MNKNTISGYRVFYLIKYQKGFQFFWKYFFLNIYKMNLSSIFLNNFCLINVLKIHLNNCLIKEKIKNKII